MRTIVFLLFLVASTVMAQTPPPVIPANTAFQVVFEHSGLDDALYRLYDTVETLAPKVIKSWTAAEVAAGKSLTPSDPTNEPPLFSFVLAYNKGLPRGVHVLEVETYLPSDPSAVQKSAPLETIIGVPITPPVRVRIISTTTVIVG